VLCSARGAALNVYSLWAMNPGPRGVGFAPLTFLLMSAVAALTDASFEEAALMAGAGPLKTFARSRCGSGLAGRAGARMLLIGIRAFESFRVPALVGLAGNVTVLTPTSIRAPRISGAINFGEAGAYSVCLLLVVCCCCLAQSSRRPTPNTVQTITGKGLSAADHRSRRWRYLTAANPVGDTSCSRSCFRGDPGVHGRSMPFYEGVNLGIVQPLLRSRTTHASWRGRIFAITSPIRLVLGVADRNAGVSVHGAVRSIAVRRHPAPGCRSDRMAPLVFPQS